MMSSFTFPEKLALVWFLIDAITHLTIEAGYVWLALTTTALKTDSYMGGIWRQYGRADSRWQVRDANVISLELITVFLMGPMALYQLYLIWAAKKSKNGAALNGWRHVLQLIICSCELYGGWMTFCPEWVDGSPNLDGSDFILLWIYLVFMNGLWVVLPALFLWESAGVIVDQFSFSAAATAKKTDGSAPAPGIDQSRAPPMIFYYLSAGCIVAYMILVPAILAMAAPVPVQL